MNPKQAKEFIEKYKGPNVRSFVKASHLEELSPLLEVHIEAVEVRKDEFHELEGGKTYMPRKETLDKFAAAAGVSYNATNEATRKEGEGCYVGRSQAMVMGPDGKMVLGDVCEYEFDADIRTEEARLNGKLDWDNKNQYGKPGKREYSSQEIEAERIQFRKVGRQRANTGARNRATVSILGMSTGFKGLFEKGEPPTASRVFLFSRVIVNAKNELVMNRMLDGIAGNAAMLYGPAPARAIEAPAQEPRPVGTSVVDQARPAPQEPEADDWGDIPQAPQIDPKVAELQNAIADYIASGLIPAKGVEQAQHILDAGSTDTIVLGVMLTRLKTAHDKAVAARGAA